MVRVKGSGFRVQGSWFETRSLGKRIMIKRLVFSVKGLMLKVWDSGFRVQSSGFRIHILGHIQRLRSSLRGSRLCPVMKSAHLEVLILE
jgi:hypothetical protein